MKSGIIYLIFLTCFTNSLYAQKTTLGITGFFKIGYTILPGASKAFNTIAPQSPGKFSNNFITLGAEGLFHSNKMIFALDGDLNIPDLTSSYKRMLAPSSGVVAAKFGWIINEGRQYSLYPSVGIGIAAFALSDYNRQNDEADILKYRVTSSPVLDLGLNADYILKKFKKLQNINSMVTGLRIGYRLCFKNGIWRDANGEKLSGMPDYEPNSYYITVAIGEGTFLKN